MDRQVVIDRDGEAPTNGAADLGAAELVHRATPPIPEVAQSGVRSDVTSTREVVVL
jgi:hypothetical protein